MKVVLTDNPTDFGGALARSSALSWDCRDDCDCACACDCDCACPVDGQPAPVLSLPVAYYLELTASCNNRCPGCGNVYSGERASVLPSLDGDAWSRLIRQLAPHTHLFNLTGGEATLHPHFVRIVETIDTCNIPFTVFTNGRWFHEEQTLKILRSTAMCDGLLISLHGPDAAIHEAFSGVPASFKETVKTIRRATDTGVNIATSIVINRHNWDRIEETMELALSVGANHIVCNRLIGPEMVDFTANSSQLRTALNTVDILRSKGHPIRLGNCVPQCFEPSSSRGCTAGATFATIDPWGRMRPCNHAALIAGDLLSQSVEDIWHGRVMTHWRSLVPAGCGTCSAFTECHGGCRAQALLLGVDQDPLISHRKVIRPPETELPLSLHAQLRPIRRFTCRSESGTERAIYRSAVVSVPDTCATLAPRLDGTLTLRQIEGLYGDASIQWLGLLYREGMISLS